MNIILDVTRYKVVLFFKLMRNPKSFEGSFNFDQVTKFEFFDFKNKLIRYPNNNDKEDLLIMKALRKTEFFEKINNKIDDNTGFSYWNFARSNSKKIRLRRLKDTENYQRRTLFRLQRRIVENDFFLRIFKMKPSNNIDINNLWDIADMSPYDRYINWSYIKTTWKKDIREGTTNKNVPFVVGQQSMLFIYAYKIVQKMKIKLKRKRQRITSTFGSRKIKISSNNQFNLKIGSLS